MKKALALFLALMLCVGLVACGGDSSSSSAAAAGSSSVAASGSVVDGDDSGATIPGDLPAYKVGVILYDLSNLWAQNIRNALEYLAADLNVTLDYGIGGSDPEAAITTAQNFGAAGFDGIITLHPGAIMARTLEVCEEYEMFLVSSNDPSSASEDYAEFSQSPWFAGEVWEDDYKVAYEIASDMIAQGAETFALTGLPEGLAKQMDLRLQGARDAIADGGATIVTEGLNFNKAEAAQNIVAQYPDVDAIFSSVESVSTVYQPVVNAGLGGQILLNCYDPAEGLAEAMEEGVINYAVEGTLADSMIAFVLLYNAMSGNPMTQADGSKPSIEMNYIVAKSYEDYQDITTYITGDKPPYTVEELSQYITAINPDASYDALDTFAGNFSLEDVKARHGA